MTFLYLKEKEVQLIELYGTDSDMLKCIDTILEGATRPMQLRYNNDLYMFKAKDNNSNLIICRICGCCFYPLDDYHIKLANRFINNVKNIG